MKNHHRLLFTAALILGSLSAVRAGDNPCGADIQNFCKGVKPGQGRLIACLKAHEADLSEACKERRVELKEISKEVHISCQDDVERLCSDVKPGEGRLRGCLKEHADEVSPACKEKIGKVKSLRNTKRL